MAASPFSLEKKVAIVTGGGVGIGRSIAVEFAKAGADVVICSRKKENLDPVVAEITKLGRRSFCEAVDVRQEEAVKAGRASTILAAGIVLALYALGFLFLTWLYALEIAVSPWLAGLIVTLLIGSAAAILINVGRKRIKGVPHPDQTIHTMKENLEWARNQTK